MITLQVMANDVAVGFGGSGGYLEMKVYKALITFNFMHSVTLIADGCNNLRRFLIEGTQPNVKRIQEYVVQSPMLVTALSPVIGYGKASKIAHYALDDDLTLKRAAVELGFVTETSPITWSTRQRWYVRMLHRGTDRTMAWASGSAMGLGAGRAREL